jgi:prepilin-type N-terminal cleavage/methylation domain-containing protein
MNNRLPLLRQSNRSSCALPQSHASGFTLIELLVVLVILTILSSLTLAGLNVGRQRAKRDKTQATIRKLNDLLIDHYESYATRSTAGATTARLGKLRLMMVEEMPDNWANVRDATAACTTAACRAYVNYKSRVSDASKLQTYQSAECLYMIVSRSGLFSDAMESFRPDEVADTDKDGLKEFIDGWGNPIAFLRWAPGFSSDTVPIAPLGWPATFPLPTSPRTLSPIQVAAPQQRHDSLDTLGSDATAFELTPLIYSPGPDEEGNSGSSSSGYGIFTGDSAWPMTASALESGICISGTTKVDSSTGSTVTVLVGSPNPANNSAYRDNVTNHDIMAR